MCYIGVLANPPMEIPMEPLDKFTGIRAFTLFKGEVLASLTGKGACKAPGVFHPRPFYYYKPTSSIPQFVFNKGLHYGFQSFKKYSLPYKYTAIRLDSLFRKYVNGDPGWMDADYEVRTVDSPAIVTAWFMSARVIGEVQHYGTVREFKYTLVSSHMLIRRIYILNEPGPAFATHKRNWWRKAQIHKLEDRYQCPVEHTASLRNLFIRIGGDEDEAWPSQADI